MNIMEAPAVTRRGLLEYFLQAARPRAEWLVGMELEQLGRRLSDGAPLPYEAESGPSVRQVLESILSRRGGSRILEASAPIGLDAPWGSISLEPGGQVEWSSRPQLSLAALHNELENHLQTMSDVAAECEIRWLDVAVDPDLPVESMVWMPKARYEIMRDYLGARGKLAHRMMTQTASIQCAFDYESPDDWTKKFRAAALLAPLATALFANSSEVDGRTSGHRSYRQVIWRNTDPDRCGLPPIVFDPGFGIEAFLDWVLRVPTIFRHRAGGLVSSEGVPFRELMQFVGCDAVKLEDWETHISTMFTDVRSYSYIEVRSADLQRDGNIFSVPCFWTGILYHDGALDAALDLMGGIDSYDRWLRDMESAARLGLDGRAANHDLRDLAREILALSIKGLGDGAACAQDGSLAIEAVAALADRHHLELRV